jgi:transcriptional regulator with XRE-family HTH domain
VGAQLRLRRRQLGLSQARLAQELGITFQQVQKYERGANRVSAERLLVMSRVLHVPLDYFFDGVELSGPAPEVPAGVRIAQELAASHQGRELARLYLAVRDARIRISIVELLRAVAEAEPLPANDAASRPFGRSDRAENDGAIPDPQVRLASRR